MPRPSTYNNDRLRPLESSLPAVRVASDDERYRAALRIAGNARSRADCLDLLDALGLDPEHLLYAARQRR